jgi:hypothetical protein
MVALFTGSSPIVATLSEGRLRTRLYVVGAFMLVVLLVVAVPARGRSAGAQDGAGATIEALQTKVADLEAENRQLKTEVAAPNGRQATAPPTPTQARTPVVSNPVELAPGLELLSYRFVYSGIYRAEGDHKATWVLGEIRNTTDQMLDAPGLKFILLDGDGNIVGDISGDPILPVIRPGQTMPIESGIFGDEPKPSEWQTEQIELCGEWGSTESVERYDPTGLELRNVDASQTSDSLSFKGNVFNGTDHPAEGVYVKAAIYDKDGRFSGWFWTALDVAIPVGKSARFQFNSGGDPHDPVGVAGLGYSYELWVGFDSAFGAC